MDATPRDGRNDRYPDRKPELLDGAADYVLTHGLAGLSIRPLASALGMSHRTLLYHFGSKEQLVLAVLDVIRARDQQRIRDTLRRAELASMAELFRAAWAFFSAPERARYNQVLHEVLALGARDTAFRAWSESVIDGRIGMIANALVGLGVPAPRARALATLVFSVVRGLQLHLLTTGDRAAANAAFEELVAGLEVRLTPASES